MVGVPYTQKIKYLLVVFLASWLKVICKVLRYILTCSQSDIIFAITRRRRIKLPLGNTTRRKTNRACRKANIVVRQQ